MGGEEFLGQLHPQLPFEPAWTHGRTFVEGRMLGSTIHVQAVQLYQAGTCTPRSFAHRTVEREQPGPVGVVGWIGAVVDNLRPTASLIRELRVGHITPHPGDAGERRSSWATTHHADLVPARAEQTRKLGAHLPCAKNRVNLACARRVHGHSMKFANVLENSVVRKYRLQICKPQATCAGTTSASS